MAWWRRRPEPPAAPAPAAAAHQRFGSLAAWRAWRDAHGEVLAARQALQAALPAACAGGDWPGWCTACAAPADFDTGGADPVNFREGLACRRCGLIARNRAALAWLVAGQVPGRARLYLTEQASRAYVWLQSNWPGAEGSEFGLDEDSRPRLQGWFEHLGGRGPLHERDVTRLDAGDGRYHAIGSFDVLEHVPDYRAALREFARCLRPGGRLVLTVPFLEDAADTLVRARVGPGGVEHLLPPEIHGDPVAGGVLCYYHFGWDLLDQLRDAGFADAAWVHDWNPREGLFGLWTLVATR